MPEIFIRNSGKQAQHVTLAPSGHGQHVLQPGQQARIITADDEHHGAVIRWLKQYGTEHSDKPFENCGQPIEIRAAKPMPEGG